MAPPTKITFELVRDIVTKLKSREQHKRRRKYIDAKDHSKGFLWPSITISLIANELAVGRNSLYRHAEKNPKIKRVLQPYMVKTRNNALKKSSDEPKRNTKAWMEQHIKRLNSEIESYKTKRLDVKIKNLQIQSLDRELQDRETQLEKMREYKIENIELQREIGRLKEENSRMRSILMISKDEGLQL